MIRSLTARGCRALAAGLSLTVCALATHAATAASGVASGAKLKVTHVAGSVHLIAAAPGVDDFVGGNVAVSVGPDGILVVDTLVAAHAPELRALLAKLSDQPVRLVVNSHVHFDHTGGNRLFGATVPIVAHPQSRQQMLAAVREQFAKRQPPAPVPASLPPLPTVTVDTRLTVHLNGEVIEIVHFPRSHTDTDLVTFFRTANVVHMGDLYFNGTFPYIAQGGSVGGLIATLEAVIAQLPPGAQVIPGHGEPSTVDGLRETLAMLKESSRIVADGIANKISLGDLKKAKVLARFDRWAEGNPFFNTDQYLEQIYRLLREVG